MLCSFNHFASCASSEADLVRGIAGVEMWLKMRRGIQGERVYYLKLLPPPCSGGSRTIFFSQNNFALTNPEKSIHKESDPKESRGEEGLDTEVLEVIHPAPEWQTLQPGTRLAAP